MTKIKKKVAGNGSILTENRPPRQIHFLFEFFHNFAKTEFSETQNSICYANKLFANFANGGWMLERRRLN